MENLTLKKTVSFRMQAAVSCEQTVSVCAFQAFRGVRDKRVNRRSEEEKKKEAIS